MSQDRTRRGVNLKARLIVKLANDKGYSNEEIAELCGVSVGSVKRWYATGRADADKIQPLEECVGPVHLTPEAAANILISIYRERRKRFRITRSQLKAIAGRTSLRRAFVEPLAEVMLDRGFYLLDGYLEEEDDFVVISLRQLNKLVPSRLEPKDLDGYLTAGSDDVEDDL